MIQRHPELYVAPSTIAGRGVFTETAIQIGDLIEICPAIVLPPKDLNLIHRTHLHDYYFLWNDEQCAIALGYGSLYNHQTHPNADYEMDYANTSINFICIQAIRAGEEITVNYVTDGQQQSELWF